jgi:diguanylate cyclase (GGDEF)-like protein/PAS domain S-box-containing protein
VTRFANALARLVPRRRRREQRLGDAFLLETLLRHSPDEIYFKDRSSRFVRASAATARRFGFEEPSELVGKWDLDFFSQDSAEEYREAERMMMDGGGSLVDHEQEERWPDGTITWAAATKLPMRAPDGTVLGLFGLNRDITARKQAELDLERQHERMATVVATQHDVATNAPILDEALSLTTERARALARADHALLVFLEDDEPVVKCEAGTGDSAVPPAVREACLARDEPALTVDESGRSVAAVPIRHGGGAAGVLAVFSKEPDAFSDADIDSLGLLSVVVSAALDRDELRQHAERSEYQALHDGLTGLPNRTLFKDRIDQAVLTSEREGTRFAVLLIDLDRFKEINDTLGHASGDHVLREVSRRLQDCVRASDTVARLGGDEFGLLLPKQSEAEAAETVRILEKLTASIEAPVEVDDLPLAVESSIGVAFYPEHGRGVDELMKRADVAMYKAKQENRPWVFYEHADDGHDPLRLTLLGELRRAIEEHELLLYYHPKARLANGSVRSVEALLRWLHPTRGLLLPDTFVPQAQETGLMQALTAYVLEEALRQVRAWADEGIDLAVSVNVATRNVIDTAFPDDVAAALARWGLDASKLELEVTESTVLEDPARTSAVLDRLHALGIRLSLDDFGTGYSSLAYLRRLPVSELKIDKSFVMGMRTAEGDAVIVRSAIDLGRNLGLEVVAEGVETEEAWAQLQEFGCDLAQGYLLATPMPAIELTSWLATYDRGSRKSRAR